MMKSKRMRWSGLVARMEKSNTYRRRPLERFGRTWEDNIKMNLREIEWLWYELDSSGSRYELLEGSCEHGNEISDSTRCCKILE
jgi:hypothetical protein